MYKSYNIDVDTLTVKSKTEVYCAFCFSSFILKYAVITWGWLGF